MQKFLVTGAQSSEGPEASCPEKKVIIAEARVLLAQLENDPVVRLFRVFNERNPIDTSTIHIDGMNAKELQVFDRRACQVISSALCGGFSFGGGPALHYYNSMWDSMGKLQDLVEPMAGVWVRYAFSSREELTRRLEEIKSRIERAKSFYPPLEIRLFGRFSG